ncbi:hypothetical protein [uncultured Mitsuokella sp.]|uniref:hypothetical protein n=1 Tax=uncultured Mitsuokella sp. TaxID=453120 RepID=UPI0026DB5392|nr:hypothetical protein [uncultured Mitsuokella sp.]
MTKKEQQKIEAACEDFREENLRIYQTDRHVEMLLPILYDDNDGACVFITPTSNGFIKVSDGGETSFHQMLTMENIRDLCMRYELQRENMPDDDPPFECEIFDVVNLDNLDHAIWRIIMAIRDSYEYVMANRIISRIEQR